VRLPATAHDRWQGPRQGRGDWILAAVVLLSSQSACRKQVSLGDTDGIPGFQSTPQTVGQLVGLDGGVASLNFGNVAIGATIISVVNLEDEGSASLVVNSVGQGTNPAFALSLQTQTPIGSGTSAPLTVQVTAPDAGPLSSTWVITTNSTEQAKITFTATANGVVVNLGIAPSELDFGKVLINTTLSKSVTLTNQSEIPLTPIVVGITGPNAADFKVPTPPAAISPSASAPLAVVFAPLQVTTQPETALLTLQACNGCAPQTVTLTGEGVGSALQILPDPLNFGFVPVGNPMTLPLTIQNASSQAFHLTQLQISPQTLAAGFSLVSASEPTLPDEIPGDAMVQLQVSFLPAASGKFQGVLLIATDLAGANTVSVPLIGIGGGPQITCLPSPVPFGQVATGSAAVHTVTCANVGTLVADDPQALLIFGALSVPDNPHFSAVFNPPPPAGGISPGASVSLSVTYAPEPLPDGGVVALDLGTLHLASNAGQGQDTLVPLSGQPLDLPPCDFQVTPGQLAFGQFTPKSGAVQSFRILDTGANDCLIDGLQLTADSSTAFSLVNGPVSSVLLGAVGNAQQLPSELDVPVTFAPPAAAYDQGQVVFEISNASNPAQSVALSGVGGTSCLAVIPPQLNFGSLGFNQTTNSYCRSDALPVSVVNTCSYDVHITGVSLIPSANTGDFSLAAVTSLPDVIVAQGGVAVPIASVVFSPQVAGAAAAILEIQTQELPAPLAVPVTGNTAVGSTTQDEFVTSGPGIDILWIVDTDDDFPVQQTITSSPVLGELLDDSLAKGLDFQMMATSTWVCQGPGADDNGSIVPCPSCELMGNTPTLITPQTANPLQTLIDILSLNQSSLNGLNNQLGACGTGVDDEEFFDATLDALNQAGPTGYNNQAIRTGVPLAVILMNSDDEDDNSVTEPTVNDFFSEFEAAKGFRQVPGDLFSWSYINPSQIGGSSLSNLSGSRIGVMVAATHGIPVNIDNADWGTALETLFINELKGELSFPLTSTPQAGSIVVTLNGQTLPTSDWTYDATNNQVVLSMAPAQGVQVVISYGVGCE
jgi:hypothetical protein